VFSEYEHFVPCLFTPYKRTLLAELDELNAAAAYVEERGVSEKSQNFLMTLSPQPAMTLSTLERRENMEAILQR
jgi:hypothetical protein